MASNTQYDSDSSLQSIDYGCFNIPTDLFDIDEGVERDLDIKNDSFDELLSGVALEQITASDNNKDLEDMIVALDQAADENLPPPETPSIPTKKSPNYGDILNIRQPQHKRFKTVTENEIKAIESTCQSENTKRNTQWGLRIFQDWSTEVYGEVIDLSTITAEELSQKLSKFYCEARPNNVNKRLQSLPSKQAEVYHKNTLINIRAALNRHLQNIGRDIDLVKDKQFKTCNKTLSGLLKERMNDGSSRPTQHKAIIPQNQLSKIVNYLMDADKSSVKLRQAVWYQLAVHFVSRGLEFHKQLRIDSFDFAVDSYGEYACINQETKQKNYQGGISKIEDTNQKKMYATRDKNCPVSLLKLLINKTDPNAQMLFNQYNKSTKPEDEIWYLNKPLSPRSFTYFMPDICKAAGVEKFTAHCLRATAITAMNDYGHEARLIMFMSGHRSESAIRSYNRSCTDAQKKAFSDTLSTLSCGINPNAIKTQNPTVDVDLGQIPHGYGGAVVKLDHNQPQSPNSLQASYSVLSRYDLNPEITNKSISSSFTSTGMLTNSVFNGCTFNFSR